MRFSIRRTSLVLAALLAAGLVGLYSKDSTASKSFTMAMEESARKDWDEAFNKTLAEPFAKIECSPGTKQTLALGSGCVDVGSEYICCARFSVGTKCTSAGKWQQTEIEGTSCEKRPAKKD